MEPHELALAALNEAVHSTSRDTLKRSNETATGFDMGTSNNAIMDSVAGAREPFQAGNEGTVSQVEGGQEDRNNAPLQPTSSHNSQSTTDGHDTPPTSASDEFSSQSTNAEAALSQLSQLSQLAAAQQPLSNTSSSRSNLTVAPSAGHKRTADGQVKPTSIQSPTSPYVRGHSRNTSAISNISAASSRIGELSSELRTRLSYAMVKVNNGWQSNSIDEVESLASQKGSPTSSNSTLHGRRSLITSPRAAIATIQSQSSNISLNSVTQAPTGDFDLYSRTEQPSRTYESFWREHSTSTNIPSHRQSSLAPITSAAPSKSLAPPADIHPAPSSRRSGTSKFSKPPTIPGQGSNSSLHNTSAPRTPNHLDFRDGNTMQTPTQKTLQEQDAIETLLFMSSPGNSGNMGHAFPPKNQGSPQQSPLRTEFHVQRGAQGRRVEFDTAASGSTGSSEMGGAEYITKMAGKLRESGRGRPDAIDRLLDEMADSSSDEEELVLNYTSPRRVTAGRV